jgi:glutamyl-tRNA(Gln) amidotransferase subunit E
MDYEALGFKAGLEIHQQLDTYKLFCDCPSPITDKVDYFFERELRPTRSELGDVDQAALAEAKRHRRFLYRASDAATCMVDADEEPPHATNPAAVDIALLIAALFNAQTVEEVHFMRKIVIDGSTTSGFQRTALVALNGHIDDVTIQTICLEEDAARTLEKEEGIVHYGLDRLGIPLIEIVTGPDIRSPQEAGTVALRIGRHLRSTKKVRRGIGTIRQDVNVSISAGNRVEIKGVQELKHIPLILENEIERQLEMVAVAQYMQERCDRATLMQQDTVDVSDIFIATTSHMIKTTLSAGGVVMAVRLPNCASLLGGLKYKRHRLGNEIAEAAKVVGGGIMHSDELPAFGISDQEVQTICKFLNCVSSDGFVLSMGDEMVVRQSLHEAMCRLLQAMDGVPQEVRRAQPDGTTSYMRPMPGAARMYPETDIPPILITAEKMARITEHLPEVPEQKITRYQQHGLSGEEARQIVYGNRDGWFDILLKRFPQEAKKIARILTHTVPKMEKEGLPIDVINTPHIEQILAAIIDGAFAKEGIPSVLAYLIENPDAAISDAIDACDIGALNEHQIRKQIQTILNENQALVKERGVHASGALMGIAMHKMRGRADGALINQVLSEELERYLAP